MAVNFRYCVDKTGKCGVVEFDIATKDSTHQIICSIDVELLLCGIRVFPCSNGNVYKLEKSSYMETLLFLKENRSRLLENIQIKDKIDELIHKEVAESNKRAEKNINNRMTNVEGWI